MLELLRSVPLLRILLPFILGIIGSYYGITPSWWIIILATSALFFLLFLFNGKLKRHTLLRDISFFLMVTAIAGLNTCRLLPDELNIAKSGKPVCARIETIEHRDASTSCLATLLADGISTIKPHQVHLVIKGNDYTISEGSIISFNPDFKPIKNLGNPHETDVKHLMLLKGIKYEQLLNKESYTIVGERPTIFNRLQYLRSILSRHILDSALSPSAQQFLIAFLLGDRSMLGSEISQSFTAAGVAHILALSGFHIGLITLILFIVFYPLNLCGRRKLRIYITLILLAFYTLLTGAAPSVTRAFVMTMFIGISTISHRHNSVWNAICGSAIVILFFNPLSLFSAGFQLSYVATIGIISFLPLINRIDRKRRTLRSLIDYFSLPVAASISTLPLILYYFNIFPLFFLVSNVVIIPLLPILILIALLALITGWGLAVHATDALFSAITTYTNWCASLPATTMNVGIAFIIVYYIALALLIIALSKRNVYVVCISILILAGTFAISSVKRHSDKLIIFNSPYELPIVSIENGVAYMLPIVNNDYHRQFCISCKRFLAAENLDGIVLDTALTSNRFLSETLFRFGNKSFVIPHSATYRGIDSISAPFQTDYAIITPKMHGTISRMLKFYAPKALIISGNVNSRRANEIEAECRTIGINVYNISSQGAFILK